MTIDIDVLDGTTPITPSDWGVPHVSWRPNQWDALSKALSYIDKEDEEIDTLIYELPTGSGKSAIPTALAKKMQVVVYVHSLALLDQYRDAYGFTIVKGMDQYECCHPDVVEAYYGKHRFKPRVSECPMEKMQECPYYVMCPYIAAREKALASRRMACTYPFALLSFNVQKRGGIGVWDEAHSSVEAIIQLSAMRFNKKFQQLWSLPQFPGFGTRDELKPRMKSKVLDWFHDSIREMERNRPNDLFPEDLAPWRAAYRRLNFALGQVQEQELYFESFEEEKWRRVKGGRRKYKDIYMLLKPFSASTLAHKLSRGKQVSLLMSATIGNPEPLTEELGIKKYQFFEYPHPIPADERPIYDLQFEKMIWNNIQKYPKIFKLQAMRIAKFLDEFPGDWRGLILCASYAKAGRLKEELEPYLGDRVYNPPEDVNRVDHFMNKKADTPGLVVVDVIQVWGQGLDLWGDLGRFAIVASVPFGNLTDRYEKVRKKKYGSHYAWWFSYNTVPQACGRVSRGEVKENGDYLLNVGAIADGSGTTGKAHQNYPNWFREAIVPWKA